MEESFHNMSISTPDEDANETAASVYEGLQGHQIEEHIALCIKLSAENKITAKNAYSLHLIGLLQKLLNESNVDLQYMSLSLQAGSKIFMGRVDALYKDTVALHSQISSIISNKKNTASDDVQNEEDCIDENNTKGKKRKTRNFKSYICTAEETITDMGSDSKDTGSSYANYEILKSAFSGSGISNSLTFDSDSMQLCCGHSKLLHGDQGSTVSEESISDMISPMLKNIFINFNKACEEEHLFSYMSDNTVVVTGNDFALNSITENYNLFPVADNVTNNVLPNMSIHEGLMHQDEPSLGDDCGADVEDALPVGDVLIVADEQNEMLNLSEGLIFITGDASGTVQQTSGGVQEPKTPRPTIPKEKKPREPFFRRDFKDTSLLVAGNNRLLCMKPAELKVWERESTNLLAETSDAFCENTTMNISSSMTMPQGNELTLFLKVNPLKPVLDITGSLGTDLANGTQRKSLFNMPRNNSHESFPDDLANNFGQLSLHDSIIADSNDQLDDYVDNELIFDQNQNAAPESNESLNRSLLAAPEFVQPIELKIPSKALELDTAKMKHILYSTITNMFQTHKSILFSELLEEFETSLKLKYVHGYENLTWQFAFILVLDLANEKCLCVENLNDDLIIQEDVNEI